MNRLSWFDLMLTTCFILALSTSANAKNVAPLSLPDECTDQHDGTEEAKGSPLSVEAVASQIAFPWHDLSPDGWGVAVNYYDADDRAHVLLKQSSTGRTIEIGPEGARSSRAKWSPDSRRIAFFSDARGKPELWIWDRATGKSTAVGGVDLASVEGAPVEWFPDSRRLLVQILPRGSAPHGKDKIIEDRIKPPFKKASANSASVYVLSANQSASFSIIEGRAEDPDVDKACGRVFGSCDLGLVDIGTGRITRLVTKVNLAYGYSPSPDGRYVAYTILSKDQSLTDRSFIDIILVDLRLNKVITLAENVTSRLGAAMTWSPNGKLLAYANEKKNGNLTIVSVSDGTTVKSVGTQDFNRPGYLGVGRGGVLAPLWSRDSKTVYMLAGDGSIWKTDSSSGASSLAVTMPGRSIYDIFVSANEFSQWMEEGSAFVVAAGKDGVSGVYKVNLESGEIDVILEGRVDLEHPRISFKDDGAVLSFKGARQQRPMDLFVYDERDSRIIKTCMNAGIERFWFADARTLSWKSSDGSISRGALLLPKDYKEGRRLPLVVWVYGGARGSESIATFGLNPAKVFNFQVFATRGYAVLFPDVPISQGDTLKDIYSAVMHGVDAAIQQGFADPNRLAIMGHSYGSFSALAVITQTDRFKVAEVSAVTHPELVTDYLRVGPLDSAVGIHYESGQGRMGGTPWEYPDRYRRNSPVYLFDKVRTPLLIANGDLDTATPPERGPTTVYAAFKKLGIPVEYRLYEGEEHVIQRKANVTDLWKRRLEFFAKYMDVAIDDRGRVVFDGNFAHSRDDHLN